MSALGKKIASLSPEKQKLLQAMLREKNIDLTQAVILPRQAGTQIPLSFAQERLWFLDLLNPGNPAYNLYTAVRLDGPLNASDLERAGQHVTDRHEILRTYFTSIAGQPSQVILSHLETPWELIDISHIPTTERELLVRQHITEIARTSFSLAKAPLWRAASLRLTPTAHLLVVVMHHIIADGWSMSLFLQEVMQSYAALSRKRPLPHPPLPIQYADYACWQRQSFPDNFFDRQLNYWREQLKDSPPLLKLPYNRPRPAVQTFDGQRHHFRFPLALTQALIALSQREGVTLFMLLLAAFQTLLYRYTEQNKIVVGSPAANRSRQELEKLVGLFINTLPLSAEFTPFLTFRELLQQVRQNVIDAQANQDVPFATLVEALTTRRELSHPPLVQVMFALQNVPRPDIQGLEVAVTLLDADNQSAMLDLTLSVVEETDSPLSGFWEYNTALFDAGFIARMATHWQQLLTAVTTHPEQKLAYLPYLTGSEQEQLLVTWNQTETAVLNSRGVHHLFEQQAAQTPDAIAVFASGKKQSYDELNRQANQLAHYLRARGVKPETAVGICLPPGIEMITAVLGVLKAGGAYLPLDPAYPQQRLAYMLTDAQAPLLLTQTRFTSSLPTVPEITTIYLDEGLPEISRGCQENLEPVTVAQNLAYVIYTSGSTGQPKGVMINHRGLTNLAQAQIDAFAITPQSRILQFAPFSFDAAVSEIFTTLLAGATLHLRDGEKPFSANGLMQQFHDEAITTVTLPPSVLAILPPRSLPALQTIIAAGEDCPGTVATPWTKSRTFLNAYGPTEGTVCATLTRWDTNGPAHPPIGRPIANVQIYLLDKQMQPVPVGVTGEIYIGGIGLARGYYDQPALTAANFVPNPFAAVGSPSEKGPRLYKTGDRGRYLSDGQLEFQGRADHQVKIRGFRVDLGEIETALRQHPKVRDAVALVHKAASGHQHVTAYVIADQIDAGDIRPFLQQKLPAYMIPASFVTLAAFPMTPSRKIDRQALAQLSAASLNTKPADNRPFSNVEQTIITIWQDVLGREQIGVDDNFFDLGGHSLAMAEVHGRLQTTLQKDITIITLFEHPTVQALARFLEGKSAETYSMDDHQERARKRRASRQRLDRSGK